jgi:putative hemolysin
VDLVLLLIFLILSALFSGSETAFFSLRRSELAELAAEGGSRGRGVVRLVGGAHSLLSALLVGNLMVNTAAGVVITALCLARFGKGGLAVAIPVATLTLLIFGEITPKMLALRYRRSLALWTVRPLVFWLWLCRPLLVVLVAGTEKLITLLPWERSGTRPLEKTELETACDLAVEEGALSETEGRFLARLLLLQDLEVHQIMTPRPEVVTLEATATWEEICSTTRERGFNCYPVVAPDRSQPLGVFHIEDLLGDSAQVASFDSQSRPLEAKLRPLVFVPESKDVAALLKEMRAGGTHLAAVVDEHGDFSGIVTLTDCLEALIGQVGDAFDLADPDVFRLDDRSWIVAGRLDLRELNEACGVALPPSRDYVTVAGFVMARLGRIPDPGDQVTHAGIRFTVLEMAEHKILRLQITRPVIAERESLQ